MRRGDVSSSRRRAGDAARPAVVARPPADTDGRGAVGGRMHIWHDTVDAPRRPGRVSPGEVAEITVGTWPIEPGQSVQVLWELLTGARSRTGGTIAARWQRNDAGNSYWTARSGRSATATVSRTARRERVPKVRCRARRQSFASSRRTLVDRRTRGHGCWRRRRPGRLRPLPEAAARHRAAFL